MACPPTLGDTCATATAGPDDGEGLGRFVVAQGARRIGWLTCGGVESPADPLEEVFCGGTEEAVDLDLLAGADTSCMVLVTSSVRRKVSSSTFVIEVLTVSR